MRFKAEILWIKKIYTHTPLYTHTMKYYLAIKKNEIMSFEATWMQLEIIVLKVRNRKTNTI